MGEERKVYKFWWESPKERDHLEDQGVDGTVGSRMDLVEIGWGGGGCGGFNRGWWWAVVNAVMNLQVLALQSSLCDTT
jgi:hypothetical protein